jgi:uncharacterized protein
MITATLQDYIEQNILPLYKTFDKAHQQNHVLTVIEQSLALAKHYKVDLEMVFTIAAYHDIGLKYGREKHHIHSAKMLVADQQLLDWFTPEQLNVMAAAVEDHRASSQHAPRSIYGKIVAEADRVIHPETTLLRTIQYGIKNYPSKSREEQYKRFLAHLNKKYSPQGYIKLWIPESQNAAQLKKLRQLMNDTQALEAEFNRLYQQEINHE